MGYELPHVLVVDDEEDLCWAFEMALNSIGFTVASVNRGEDALKYLAEHPCAIAFVDAKIPDMDGLTLAALIGQQSPRTSVVLISGFFYQEDKLISEGLRTRLFDAFIAKPCDLNEIRLLAERAAERANGLENV